MYGRLYTRDDMVEYVKHRLGYPALELELELQEKEGLGHIHLCINDTLDWFYRENADEAVYHDWMALYTRRGVIEYDTPEGVTDIVDASPSMGNAITPWTAIDVGPAESLMAMTGWQQFDFVTWAGAQRTLSDFKKAFGVMYQVRFHPVKQKVILYPTPKQDRLVLCKIYRKAAISEVFANILFRDLCVARTKIIWGEILTRDDFQMPGGGRVNGQKLLDDARADKEKLEDLIYAESARPFIMTDLDL
jgi:hypothetical protein